jgi:hypothetical protein
MPSTYTLISSNVLSSSAASVTFSAIPSTFTDLVLRVSVRRSASGRQDLRLAVNGSTSDGSNTWLEGSGAAATSGISAAQYVRINNIVPSTAETASTFGSAEFYLPNYTVATKKPIGIFGAGENNATTAYIGAVASLYNQTTAISSLVLSLSAGSFDTGSSFYLYGIKNS